MAVMSSYRNDVMRPPRVAPAMVPLFPIRTLVGHAINAWVTPPMVEAQSAKSIF